MLVYLRFSYFFLFYLRPSRPQGEAHCYYIAIIILLLYYTDLYYRCLPLIFI